MGLLKDDELMKRTGSLRPSLDRRVTTRKLPRRPRVMEGPKN